MLSENSVLVLHLMNAKARLEKEATIKSCTCFSYTYIPIYLYIRC